MVYAVETSRLWLERLAEKHAEDYYEIVTGEESVRWSVAAPLENVAQAQSHIKTLLDQPEADKFAILLRPDSDTNKESPKMIGIVGTKAKPELAYTIHSEYANKRYMTEALNAFVGPKGIFWDLPDRKHIQTLKCQIDPDNISSLKLVQKIGAREGERRLKAYPLHRDRGPDGRISRDKFRDLAVWWVDRPQPWSDVQGREAPSMASD
ncbi:hypothetical protein L207DRAFT_439356 [Hyaloscypha variabilis F]|uniref:N-acetyltransferase domain-containing protein n=1 Tax=Hyaloscypha variabilis (strain UAMH 11265 / GT02V1 / F) TaxID=1149755 RepID=A0A2J6R495_HYAVF|nr:hypothetical protein L207DRAFT_439356 [Hyaloscypha variabilis F]